MGSSTFNNNSNIISENLKKYRIKNKLSQEQLCNKLALLGITMYKMDIYRIEHNKRSVKDFELLGLSKILKVDIRDLFLTDLK